MTQLECQFSEDLSVREVNIKSSPKNNGSSSIDSVPYLEELGINIIERPQPIQFFPNSNELVHGWSSYVQGFSANFVQNMINRYKTDYISPVIFDPFAGSGTALVQAKLNGYKSYGVELNPLLQFIAQNKLNTWDVEPDLLLKISNDLPLDKKTEAPSFLKSKKHFNPGVLINLEKLKGGIDSFEPSTTQEKKIRNLLLLAFSAILVDCSNLKRTPCLGYSKKKKVYDSAPYELFHAKISHIVHDLRIIQQNYLKYKDVESNVFYGNSKTFKHDRLYDLVVTSPPYMNGLDYVINYKIEMSWLGFATDHKELKEIKDDMVVCDNVSKSLVKEFSIQKLKYSNAWIEKIKSDIEANIKKRGKYRRLDMPHIVHKYFDDMHQIMVPVIHAIHPGGRFVLVVGDSLIADTYVPTDLLIARIGKENGMTIEAIEKARSRRSGQVRSYKLRETIIILRKN